MILAGLIGSLAAAGGGGGGASKSLALDYVSYSTISEGVVQVASVSYTNWDDSTVYWTVKNSAGAELTDQVNTVSGTLTPGTGDGTVDFNFTFNADATTEGPLTYYVYLGSNAGQQDYLTLGPYTCADSSAAHIDVFNLDPYYWSNNVWADTGGQDNDANTVAVTRSTDNGGVLIFNGTSSYASPPSLTNSIYDSVTVSAWVKPTAATGSSQTIIAKELVYKLRINNDGVVSFMVKDQDSGSWSTTINTQIGYVASDTWVNIAATVDSSNTKIYINGLLIVSGAGVVLNRNTVPLDIGAYTSDGNSTQGDYFAGRMGEVKMWNYVKTASVLLDQYNSSAARYGLTPIPLSLEFGGDSSPDYMLVREAGYYGGSAAFSNASLSYISVEPDASLALGTNDFTIEWWQYQTERGPYDSPFGYFTTGHDFYFPIGTAQYLLYANGSDTFSINVEPSNLPSLNAWHHFAVVRDGTTFTLYVDGTSVGTATSAIDLGTPTSPITVGSSGGFDGSTMTGRITNFRIVNGTAVYTENFTPQRGPLAAISNTVLLLLNVDSGSLIADSSGNDLTITNNNSVSWSSSTNILNYDFNLGTTYTIEWWSKATTATIASGAGLWTVMSQNYNGSGIDIIYQDAKLKINNGTVLADEPVPGQWTHVALVNNAGTITLYYNGTSVHSGSNWNLNNTNDPLIIGKRGPSNFQYFPGKLAMIRISTTARYTTVFTPSIAYGADGDTRLFLGSSTPLEDTSTVAHTITNTGVTRSTDFPVI